MVMPRLRHIAVHVEEPDPGNFAWVLTERKGGGSWRELDKCTAPLATYQAAMAAGLVVLQAMVGDLDVGPRAEEAAPPGGAKDEKRQQRRNQGAPPKEPAPAKPYFWIWTGAVRHGSAAENRPFSHAGLVGEGGTQPCRPWSRVGRLWHLTLDGPRTRNLTSNTQERQHDRCPSQPSDADES